MKRKCAIGSFSPYFAAMAVVISSLSVNWSTLLPYLLGLSLTSLLVSLAVDYKGLRYIALLQTEGKGVDQTEPTANKGKSAFPAGLGVYLAAAIIVILVLERLVELPMVLITCMAAVLFPLIWCLAKGALSTYRQGLANHVTVTLPALKKEMTLFLAAVIPIPISLSFSVFTVALITVTSMAGLHPIVLVTILATGIDPAVVHISPNYFAVLLLGSWGLSNPVSPASAVNNLLAGLFKKPVYEFALPNYKFAACMGVMLLLYLVVVRI